MADIFISYARSNRSRIEPLAEALEQSGYRVWWDHRIAGGTAFSEEIERALAGARCVVVVWSRAAVQSEWVLDEAAVGKRDGKLIPIRLDATVSPMGYRQLQEIDFSEWDGSQDDAAFKGLRAAVDRYVRRDNTHAPSDLIEERAASGYADGVAVLPLENFCENSDQQFLVDGMHESIITELSKIGSLKVISRRSVRAYADTVKSAREIGAELNVAKLVEGSVTRGGDVLRVNVQLVDARRDQHIWGESFDRSMSDVMTLQREIARAIAQQISLVLTPEEKSRLAGGEQVDAAAHQAYLKGMYHWYKLSPVDLEIALKEFDRALAADPEYAPAFSAIATVWAGLKQMGAVPTSVGGPRMKAAVDRALSLDPDQFQAHCSLGIYHCWTSYEWNNAEAAFRRALELNPNFPDAYAYLAHLLAITGRGDEAAASMAKALDIDPFNPLIRSLNGAFLMFRGDYELALREQLSVVRMLPGHWLPYDVIARTYVAMGRMDAAAKAKRKLHRLLGHDEVAAALSPERIALDLRAAFADAAEALERQARKSHVLSVYRAELYHHAGNYENAIEALENAYEQRDPMLPYLYIIASFGPEVLEDERIVAIAEKMALPRFVKPKASKSTSQPVSNV